MRARSNGIYSTIIAGTRIPNVTTSGQANLALAAPTLAGVPADTHCARVHSLNKAALDRSKGHIVLAPLDIIADYRTMAVPFADALGNPGEIWMAFASEDDPTLITDTEQDMSYRQVMPGHDYLVSAMTQYVHDIARGPIEYRVASLVRRFDRARECSSATPDLASTVGIPTAFEIDGRSIGGPVASPIPLSSTGVQLERALVDGEADYTIIQVFELTLNGDTTVLRTVENIVAMTSPLRLPTTSFVPGGRYIAAFTTVRGYPGAATGDFRPLDYPNEIARFWSAPFTVGEIR